MKNLLLSIFGILRFCHYKAMQIVFRIIKKYSFVKLSFIFRLTKIFKWWSEAESNCRHADFQSAALPTELSNHDKKEK